MRVAAAIVAVLLAAVPAAADDREAIIETLGGISIAPRICGIAIDRDALAAVGRELLPDEPGLAAEIVRVDNRIASRQGYWTVEERVAWCEASATLADRLGVLR